MATLNGKEYNLSNPKEQEEYWTEYAKSKLLGKRITGVRYLDEEEMNTLGWNKRTLVIHLEGGTIIYPSMDDEGNDGGSLFGQNGKEDLTFPVL